MYFVYCVLQMHHNIQYFGSAFYGTTMDCYYGAVLFKESSDYRMLTHTSSYLQFDFCVKKMTFFLNFPKRFLSYV